VQTEQIKPTEPLVKNEEAPKSTPAADPSLSAAPIKPISAEPKQENFLRKCVAKVCSFAKNHPIATVAALGGAIALGVYGPQTIMTTIANGAVSFPDLYGALASPFPLQQQ
jgi:hypothetical protein